MKKFIYYILLMITVLLLFGCKKDKKSNESGVIQDYIPGVSQGVTLTEQPTIGVTGTDGTQTDVNDTVLDNNSNHEGDMRSFLSGLWVSNEIGRKRPYAFQFSNFKAVSNQWGIGQAEIVYEAMVEGGITRLLGIGEQYSGDRIGSARSSRHYFASFADEYDAIYIHYGKTKYAKAKLKELGINNLDGETGIGTTVFYRDNTIKAPHNAFASLEGILAGIKEKGYETQYDEGYQPHYTFYGEDTNLTSGTVAGKITINFSSYIAPYLEYNAADKLYYRFQFGAIHKDSLTGKQLAFKNIIVQFVKEWDIDKNDYQTMDLEDASGTGYYITNGKKISITWKKKEATSWTRYYNEAGEELTINPGKTYIAVFPNNRRDNVVIE